MNAEPLLTFLHQRLGVAAILMAVLLGLLGLFQFITRRQLSGGFRSGYLLLVALVAAQGIPGAIRLFTGGHPRELLHVVYGIFAIAFLPGLYFYTRDRKPDTEAALLTAGCFIVVIAFLRGFTTGA